MRRRLPLPRFAIKDSFARLDLAPHGLTPLFDATWIAMPTPAGRDESIWDVVASPDDLVRWEAAWAGGGEVIGLFPPALLDDPDCVVLARRQDGTQVGGAIAFTASGVTGISNVFKSEMADGPLWEGVVRAVAELRPGLPIVGYENGEDLAAAQRAGFTAVGPLRVWARGSAVA